jgi:hypothetical protein
MTDNLDAHVNNFLLAAQERVNATYGSNGAPPTLSVEHGPRYIRVVANKADGDRSAFCFIDKQTGDVLKTAGWKGPAKNFARGNIRDANHGAERAKWTGVY